jgi:hypothetical protein
MFLDFAAWLQSSSPSLTIQTVTWIIPLTQSIHILTIGIVFVSILVIASRILGIGHTDVTFEAVRRRFTPWIGYGLVVMATTGVVLVIGEPLREFSTLSFWLKMGLLIVGIVTGTAFLRALRAAASADPARELPRGAKSAAIATVAIWVCIIYLGRTIAYDIEIWGSYSLAAGPERGAME